MAEVKVTMKAARLMAGKTQDEVANALKVSKKTIVSWEKGRTAPTVEKALLFCKFCNISYDAITFLRHDAI